jgi:hypothetical protein
MRELASADAVGSGSIDATPRLIPRFVHVYLDQNGQCDADLHPRAAERANRARAWLPVVLTRGRVAGVRGRAAAAVAIVGVALALGGLLLVLALRTHD